jgi:hemoglobin/transferrin/lactoferrin receptor protein
MKPAFTSAKVRCLVASSFLTLCLSAVAQAQGRLTGEVTDAQGTAVFDAAVSVMTGDRTLVVSATTDTLGAFAIPSIPAGSYFVEVRKSAFAEGRAAVRIIDGQATSIIVTLRVVSATDQVTITAARGIVESVGTTGQPLNVITAEEIANRAKTVVAQGVEGETGVALQRTSPSMAGVFIRGLVGNKVNVFVDGVRYSNGAQRGGVNTFLDLIEAGNLDSIEILRGPSSDQYGSDSLGGSIHFLSKVPQAPADSGPVNGEIALAAGTAHRHGGGNVLLSFVRPRLGIVGFASGRKVGLLRPGGGYDSHAAVTRFLGTRSDRLMNERLPDTGFDQSSSSVRANWTATNTTRLVAAYTRTDQHNADRYDQLLGGDGNLISELNGLSLDLFSFRFERLAAGPFQHLSLNYAINSQREERVNQGGQGSATATIGHEPERTTAHSISGSMFKQVSSRTSFTGGGDVQFERLSSDAFNVNPGTGAHSPRRPRVPSGATFTQGGVFTRMALDAVPDRVRFVASIRVGGAHYEASSSDSPLVNGQPLWPDDSLTTIGVGFRAAAVFTPDSKWTLSGLVSRGFRSPHMTDLGTLGLTGSGFEVAAPDVANMNATVGTAADATAVSTGLAVGQVGAETSLNIEGTASYRDSRFRGDLTVFVNHIYDNIQKQALILPQGAVGQTIAGNAIMAQNTNGVVFVALSTVPVLVRSNFDNARIWGIEQAFSAELGHGLLARSAFTYLRAQDTQTLLPPNIEGGTPHPDLFITVRWTHSSNMFYVEPYVHKAWTQPHLSSLDRGDRRVGASRNATSIGSFFSNGARNRGWVDNGPDGISSNADDRLSVTGETLAQIQARVLGGSTSSSLFTSIPGYVVYNARFGFRMGLHELVVDIENIGDENYRGLSWGADAPGRGVSLRYGVRF